jgi:transposase
MAYDEKFRLAVIKFKDGGHTFAQMREIFGVHPQSYYRWKEALNENGVIKNHYPKTHKGKIDPARLLQLLDEHPDWYLKQFAAEFRVCHQAVQKRFAALGVTRKKKLLPILESPKKKGKGI